MNGGGPAGTGRQKGVSARRPGTNAAAVDEAGGAEGVGAPGNGQDLVAFNDKDSVCSFETDATKFSYEELKLNDSQVSKCVDFTDYS